MNKQLLRTAVLAGAIGAVPAAHAGFNFDVNGDTAPGGLAFTNVFDWFPDNVLFDGAVPIPTGASTPFTFRAQGRLGTLTGGALDTGAEITFVMEVPSLASFIGGGGGTSFGFQGSPAGGGTMKMYYDNTGPGGLGTTGGVKSNDITGAGYADGRLIAEASIDAQLAIEFGSLLVGSTNVGKLDKFGADNQFPITTVNVSGNVTHKIEWTSLDDTFFVDVQDPGGLANMKNPLGPDATWTTDTLAAFFNANPSDTVGGVAPDYGNGINDNLCGGGGGSCDMHVEADARQPFNVDNLPKLPEPTSAALLGLGLLGFGAVRRARKKAA